MAHTYVFQLIHVVFSTKERAHAIPGHMQHRLWSFLGGIARKNGFKALAIGGTQNHVHILLSLPATIRAIDERRIVEMVERDHQVSIRMAAGLWRFQCRHFTASSDNRLHQFSGAAPREAQVRRRVHRVFNKTQCRLRFALCSGANFSRPIPGLYRNFDLPRR